MLAYALSVGCFFSLSLSDLCPTPNLPCPTPYSRCRRERGGLGGVGVRSAPASDDAAGQAAAEFCASGEGAGAIDYLLVLWETAPI